MSKEEILIDDLIQAGLVEKIEEQEDIMISYYIIFKDESLLQNVFYMCDFNENPSNLKELFLYLVGLILSIVLLFSIPIILLLDIILTPIEWIIAVVKIIKYGSLEQDDIMEINVVLQSRKGEIE